MPPKKKKPGKRTMIEATEQETKPVRLDLPIDVHRLLRIVASFEDVSMAAYARNQLATHLREEAKRRGIK